MKRWQRKVIVYPFPFKEKIPMNFGEVVKSIRGPSANLFTNGAYQNENKSTCYPRILITYRRTFAYTDSCLESDQNSINGVTK